MGKENFAIGRSKVFDTPNPKNVVMYFIPVEMCANPSVKYLLL
jgi:hypothetical protein